MSWYDDSLKKTDARIAWVLAHPGMSLWLKETLGAALERDPVDILNDLEILNHLLRARSDALIHAEVGGEGGDIKRKD
ncbi:MAG: hypothetical protein JSR96_06340 [Proteobacteria bacterium]|nr:hypothetical protein [Pseudomonadota bacterium]